MTIREADAFYKLLCFEPAYREKMAGALGYTGLRPLGSGLISLSPRLTNVRLVLSIIGRVRI
jgi:hypothetical protein